jgi:hypothetical protein
MFKFSQWLLENQSYNLFHISKNPNAVVQSGFRLRDTSDGIYFSSAPDKRTNIKAVINPKKVYDRNKEDPNGEQGISYDDLRQQGYDLVVQKAYTWYVPGGSDGNEYVVLDPNIISNVSLMNPQV